MNTLEQVAAGLGVVNVALVVRRSIWNYPFALAMVTLYFFVFRGQRLYSDMLLQVFFFAVNLYGWWNWLRVKTASGDVPVGLLTARERVRWVAGTIVASLVWGYLMDHFTPAAAPYVDAFVAGTSIAAQILLARRKVENWVLWILVDIVAVGLYWSRGMGWETCGLYAIFLLLSVIGLVDWRRKLRAQGRPA